eukprot:CAMPEP_0119339552 /NCGR_PEP_ID=MMETSP1333-20130426/98490_1 /TAXON_ID=418940 /ORGANISM="Scyphosphaera apsteinii, Strain RCC1455" /LENGTH=186 /DNA_ID=CAMNT_0007351089 /DNA_START=101 /DNA_END=661 /DNA_ORIENTATION=+
MGKDAPVQTAAAALAATLMQSVPESQLLQTTQLQSDIHTMLRTTNEQLDDFNNHSALMYASVAARLGKHTRTLSTVQSDLMGVFKRVRALKRKLISQHPELQAASDALDAASEAALEIDDPNPRGALQTVELSTSTPRLEAQTSAVSSSEDIPPPSTPITNHPVFSVTADDNNDGVEGVLHDDDFR